MRTLIVFAAVAGAALAQGVAGDVFARAETVLGWRVSPDSERRVVQTPATPQGDAAWQALFGQARARNAAIVVVPVETGITPQVEATAARANVSLAVAGLGPGRIKVWADPESWVKAGLSPLAVLANIKDRLIGGRLDAGPASEEILKEAYRLDLKPLFWVVSEGAAAKTTASLEALISYHQSYASRTPGVRRLAAITAEERARIEAALPASAPATPKKARKLLVIDLNVGRFGHPSIPYANLAMQLMGRKTGAFEATVTSDSRMLEPDKLKEFDAVFLNNTIGDIFATPAARDGFASFVANGGGVMANHAATVTATGWSEFGEILGGRGASHRMADERVTINVEGPPNPITGAFGGKTFEYADEIFRYQPPYSRDKVRVLLSVDPVRTDMNQGRCFGQCLRDDNDYPVAWIRAYNKGRVFYTTLGHNPHVFWEPRMLAMFLAAAQYALGDLDIDAAPRPKGTQELDAAILALSSYTWGQDQAPLRKFQQAMSMLGSSRPAAAEAERKMLPLLNGSASLAAKDAVCRQLAVIGSEASVATLARMLARNDTAEMARYALEGIPGAAATKALRDRLASAPASLKPGIILSLARRRDPETLQALIELSKSSDASVTGAAVNGLGMIGTPAASVGLAGIDVDSASDALLTAAEGSPAREAAIIYSGLAGSKLAGVRAAAWIGLARVGAAGATTRLAAAITDDSPAVRAAAIAALARADATALSGALKRLDAVGRIEALHLLAMQGQKQSLPAFLDAAKSPTEEERIAALRGMAELGGPEQVPMLVDVAVRTTGGEQEAARFALTRMPAASIDAAISAALDGSARGAKLELIRAAGQRGMASSADALLAAASADADSGVRREAIRALRAVATPAQAGALVGLLRKSSEEDLADYEAALSAAIRRADKPDILVVTTALEPAQASAVQAALVSVLASTGSPEALLPLRQALRNSDPAVQRSAVKGLTEWPSPDPLPDLQGLLAQSTADPAVKVLALRGAVKLAQLPAERPPAATAKILGELLAMASRPEEKRLVIAALQRVVAPESLELVRSARSDPAVAAEANNATAILERALSAQASR